MAEIVSANTTIGQHALEKYGLDFPHYYYLDSCFWFNWVHITSEHWFCFGCKPF
ncbi:hypothetical protein Tsubulata_049145 [Turnera subulata]|uniref:Uncharacterized protein n=1 Tax=Turnera subulata TaxID=218843 RepID=A0A9Q0G5X0_9ROSI|nr:hypothetical protein Tsubulata_049145 [Turnera subulata]